MSSPGAIADAVVEFLNDPARSYAGRFNACRRAVVVNDLEQLERLTVGVYLGPRLFFTDQHTRPAFNLHQFMFVSFQQFIAADSERDQITAIDRLVELVLEVESSLINQSQAGFQFVSLAENEPERDPFLLEQMQQESTFATVISATYGANLE